MLSVGKRGAPVVATGDVDEQILAPGKADIAVDAEELPFAAEVGGGIHQRIGLCVQLVDVQPLAEHALPDEGPLVEVVPDDGLHGQAAGELALDGADEIGVQLALGEILRVELTIEAAARSFARDEPTVLRSQGRSRRGTRH